MKRSVKKSKNRQFKSFSNGIKIKVAQPAKKLNELVTVYEDLENTIKRLRTSAILCGSKSLKQINVHKLIAQLSKSKRKIERKISSTLVHEKAQLSYRLGNWAPKLSKNLSKEKRSKRIESSAV
ncbi:MAG: hypothetical protein FJ112_07645 [Deltaproteobacteria bacterium]|nr:hypothetical protein [Deltaproteobacteria bacterium]